VPVPLLPWAARSLGLPHAGVGPADYRTQYSNTKITAIFDMENAFFATFLQCFVDLFFAYLWTYNTARLLTNCLCHEWPMGKKNSHCRKNHIVCYGLQ
jgi:hypothetical protein